jgi:hypothetical protein
MGAITSGGIRVLNEDLVQVLDVTSDTVAVRNVNVTVATATLVLRIPPCG